MSKTSPPPLSASDTEALFCVALLNTLDTRQTADVLAKFLELRENPSPVLVALGRIPGPDAMFAHHQDVQEACDRSPLQGTPLKSLRSSTDPQPTPAQPVPPFPQPTDTIRTADNPNFRP